MNLLAMKPLPGLHTSTYCVLGGWPLYLMNLASTGRRFYVVVMALSSNDVMDCEDLSLCRFIQQRVSITKLWVLESRCDEKRREQRIDKSK